MYQNNKLIFNKHKIIDIQKCVYYYTYMDKEVYVKKSRQLINIFMATVDIKYVNISDILGIGRSAVSHLIKRGTFQLSRFIYILDYFGYELQIVKKKSE